MARDPDNPSSIQQCLDTARHNARAVRTALTTDMWEGVNATWLEASTLSDSHYSLEKVRGVLDWVKERSLQFNGAVANTAEIASFDTNPLEPGDAGFVDEFTQTSDVNDPNDPLSDTVLSETVPSEMELSGISASAVAGIRSRTGISPSSSFSKTEMSPSEVWRVAE